MEYKGKGHATDGEGVKRSRSQGKATRQSCAAHASQHSFYESHTQARSLMNIGICVTRGAFNQASGVLGDHGGTRPTGAASKGGNLGRLCMSLFVRGWRTGECDALRDIGQTFFLFSEVCMRLGY